MLKKLIIQLFLLLSVVVVANGATIQLPKTGQITSYATGDDGANQTGAALPSPRFTDNSNGTVTDNLTGLVWLKDANCFGFQAWSAAISSANTLASGACGLTDGSIAGQWRLPNFSELESLLDAERANPPLPAGNPFAATVQADFYWSSNTYVGDNTLAWVMHMGSGSVLVSVKDEDCYVWAVRGGQ